MPLTPLNNDFLQCPICFNAFSFDRKPITLTCCHTCCSTCLKSLQSCPFDQTFINHDLPENEAILSLLTINNPNVLNNFLFNISTLNNDKLIDRFNLTQDDLKHYRSAINCIQNLAQLIKPQNSSSNLLSRPMQRKLISLLHCQLVEGDGRLKAVKFCRSIGERITSELLLKHQDPYTLSANLWAAVRSRGCQFLGPALQEEILKLVLSALEDGSHLSRKVLVMFVVQRLSPSFPHQASKTAIGHVIQLLYRASCFRLTKRDGDSSLMQLKEEYCSYEALRREHDTQIVSIALESGLKISPDQWSSFLYGSPSYKSHMQSIIDKLQSPQSFNQSIQELIIALQRTHDPANLIGLKDHLERLAKIESTLTTETTLTVHHQNDTIINESKIDDIKDDLKEKSKVDLNDELNSNELVVKDLKNNNLDQQRINSKEQQSKDQKESIVYPTFEELADILDSCKIITFRLVEFLKQYNTLFSNVFRFSRSSNFGSTSGKFNNNKNVKLTFNGTKSKSPISPTNEDELIKNKQLDNLFSQQQQQNSINNNCKTVQLSHGNLSNSGINTVINTTTVKLDYNTTNSINSINSIGSLNKINNSKLKPCAHVLPTVLQQQNGSGSTLNGSLSNVLNGALKSIKTTTASSPLFNQSNSFYLNQKLTTNKTFNGHLTNGTKLNATVLGKTNGHLTNGNLTNGHLANGQLKNSNLTNGNLTNGNLTNGNLTNGDLINDGLTNGSTKSNYLTNNNLKIDTTKSLFYNNNNVTNENQKNNQNIQNNQQQIKTHQSPIKHQELFEGQLNHLNQLIQPKKNGINSRKSNQNSFSFDDGDDQFIPFDDKPNPVSKFGPISRAMNLINTQTITLGSANADNLKNESQICKNTNVVLGTLPSLIRPFNTSLYLSNEPCFKK